MRALDEGNFACGIFSDLQNAFDTVDHNSGVFHGVVFGPLLFLYKWP